MTPNSAGARILERVVKRWQAESKRRKTITTVDPVADAIDYCAAELEGAIKDAIGAEARLTVEEYAERTRLTPQSVRAQCRRGKLDAERTSHGWLIRVAA